MSTVGGGGANGGATESSSLGALLQSRKRRDGPRGNSRWKVHYWVINTAERKICLYKNDQTLQYKIAIDADEVSNVAVSSDKHNKFFHLLIRIRGDITREVRMQSREQRDRWMAAVLEMIRVARNEDRTHSVLSVTRQQTDAWSREFGLKFDAELDQIARLKEREVALYVSGLAAGAELLRHVVAVLPAHLQVSAVSHVSVTVLFDEWADHIRETRYDPAGKLLRIAVKCVTDPHTGVTTYQTVDAGAVLQIVGSTLWRNPDLEEFSKPGSAGRTEADRIARLLQIPSFDVSLEWTHYTDDDEGSATVKRYIDKFVNAKLLADVHRVFQNVIHNDTFHRQTGAINDAASPTTAATENLDTAKTLSPVACLARFVKGVAIVIDSASIAALRMPVITVRHDTWRAPELGPAFIVTTQHRYLSSHRDDRLADASFASHQTNVSMTPLSPRQAGGVGPGTFPLTPQQQPLSAAQPPPAAVAAQQTREDPLQALGTQLHDIILHVRIADACRRFEAVCSELVGLSGGCTVSWESLIVCMMSCNPALPETAIHLAIQEVVAVYATRLRQVKAALAAAQLTESVSKAIRSWRVVFATPQANARVPMPHVENHAFIDPVMMVGAHHVVTGAFAQALVPLSRNSSIRLAFTVPQLGPWFLGFCAVEANLAPFPEQPDESDGEPSEEEDDIGDAVAEKRKSETKVLTDHDVVTLVYDSQNADRSLMVSASMIAAGMDAMHQSFRTVIISRHDLARVLTLTLKKVRKLALNAGAENGVLPSLAAATECLRQYCEYPQSQDLIAAALADTSHGGSPTTVANAGRDKSVPPTAGTVAQPTFQQQNQTASLQSPSPAAGEPTVPFSQLAWAVLVWLMPAEAVLAMQSRRDVLLVGLENTGKTLIVNQLRGISHGTDPSVGVSTAICPYKQWVFGMKELGGRPEVRRHFKYHVPICGRIHGVIVVVDAAQSRLYPEAKEFFTEVLHHRILQGLPCLLLVNNFSGGSSATLDSIVHTALAFPDIAGKRPWHAASCDVTIAKHGASIDPGLALGLEWLGVTLAQC